MSTFIVGAIVVGAVVAAARGLKKNSCHDCEKCTKCCAKNK